MKPLIHLYILSLPFVSAFAYSGTLTLSLVLALCIFILNALFVVAGKPAPERLRVPVISYFFLLVFYCIAVIAYLYSGLGEKKAFNHLLAYSTVILLFFLSIVFALHRNAAKLPVGTLLRTVTVIVVISCLFTLFEAISYNLISLDLNKYIPRPSIEDYGATALGKIVRVRGFAPESGHYALMLEILGPLALYDVFVARKESLALWRKITLLLLLLSNIVLTYSTASFAVIAASSAALLFLYALTFFKLFMRGIVKPGVVLGILIAIPLIFKLEQKLTVFNSIYMSIQDKLGGSYSQRDREEKFENMVQRYKDADFIHQAVGFGPSGFRIAGLENAAISLYPTYLFETGFLGLVFFLMFLGMALFLLLTLRSTMKYFLLFAFIAATAHYYFIGDYWYPWFWFLIAFMLYVRSAEQRDSRVKSMPAA